MKDNFVVEAEAAWGHVGEFSNSPTGMQPGVVVRVKKPDGSPVTGLKKSNFKVSHVGFEGNMGHPVKIEILTLNEISTEVLPGTYALLLPEQIRSLGQHVFAVTVKKTTTSGTFQAITQGQALTAFVKLTEP